ncbi:aromatic compound dioxygenase [Cristinia sonorae]|uniref:Aromatic compound dioxygenase n=1 Tax=Cristinia sonorae TaxID=1940300 RepID=A0A8K0UFB2_9AGAR|nr:aromatic compound dioxygenase [Cristinia sonorae]
MADDQQPKEHKSVPNGIKAPHHLNLPYPDKPELITSNLQKLIELVPNPRHKFVFERLIAHMHDFINETSITTEEWMSTIQFLTNVGQTCTPIRQEFILLSDVLGVSALVDSLNNPPVKGATESSVLGPFFTDDAPDVEQGGSIASEGKGKHMYVEGLVLSTDGTPVPDAVIETWETDELGFYDTQYTDRQAADCRGRLRSDKDGRYGYRAVVPVCYPIPGDGPVGDLLIKLGRHNMRPNHLHLMVEAPGFRKLVTALYPAGDEFLASDAVFGVKKGLVVNLEEINDDAEARRRGFPNGGSFTLLKFDIILSPEAESEAARKAFAEERSRKLKESA